MADTVVAPEAMCGQGLNIEKDVMEPSLVSRRFTA